MTESQAPTVHFCGDERGINDRGVYVPDGLKREEIVLIGKLLEDEFGIEMYPGRNIARNILLELMKLKNQHAEPTQKQRMTRPAGAPTYKEPMIIIGIEARPDGTWQPFEPYRLLPDGSM